MSHGLSYSFHTPADAALFFGFVADQLHLDTT